MKGRLIQFNHKQDLEHRLATKIDKNPDVKIIDIATWERDRDEKALDQQYEEFVSLLKYFVTIQEDKCDYVTVSFSTNGVPKVYDSYNTQIKLENLESVEDSIMSTLISKAPKQIHFKGYNKGQANIVKLIESVFEGRVISQ